MSRISSFIQFDPQETFEREFFITHSSLKRFRASAIALILVALLWFGGAGLVVLTTAEEKSIGIIFFVLSLLPAILLFLYYFLRKPRVSYGYATLTNKRMIYYEYNSHEAVNYHFVKSLYLSDITAAQFSVQRSLFRKSFLMALFTEFKALTVGAQSWLSWLKIFGKETHLEPGPDALEFIQTMSGQIALRQFDPQWSSHTA
ncbi:MAG TPA: hypothetical protein VGY55_12330 [Pirellulales bacterium]|jgi:hypothetical protein|nr:hypothetical protein [Pirellulales bacterium]